MFHNGIYICISWYRKICRFPVKNEYVSRTQEVMRSVNCLDLFEASITVSSFVIVGYVSYILGRRSFLTQLSSIIEQPWKDPSWIGLIFQFIYCLLCQKRTWNNIYFFKAMPCRKYGCVFQILYLKETLIVLNCSYN